MSVSLSLVTQLPRSCGVYLFKNTVGEVLYVGKAIDLRTRVRSYFAGTDTRHKVRYLVPQIADIQIIEVPSEFEALLLEASLIKHYLPRYNSAAKDDKQPLYIAVTKETFAKIRLVRKSQNIGPAYIYGPFPSSYSVRQVLRFLRKIFRYCTCKHDKGRPCLYASIGLCEPCPRRIITLPAQLQTAPKRRYQRQMRLLRALLAGKAQQVIKAMRHEMNQASQKLDFETAATYRDGLEELRRLLQPQLPPGTLTEPLLADRESREAALDRLQTILNEQGIQPQVQTLSRIEAYDISTQSGKYSTGSLVVFTDGLPNNSQYRQFKIKQEGKPNDVGMMSEMLTRRFSRTKSESSTIKQFNNLSLDSWPLPDLIVVDGGLPQLHTAAAILDEKHLNLPLISLAKREEEIYLHQGNGQAFKLKLSRRDPALQVIQHLRDEAHRFANRYRKKLIARQFK